MAYLFVVFFGALGSLMRFAIDSFLSGYIEKNYWITFFINMLGALLLGFIAHWNWNKLASIEHLRLALMVGLCGGFTTFSTFSFQLLKLLENADYSQLLLYLSMSIIGGVFFVFLGISLAKIL